MTKRRLRKGVGVAFALLFLVPAGGGRPAGLQDTTAIKQRADYMSDVLRRNTKPLGLKEDKLLRELLRQANFKWAIRATGRYILD